MPLLLISMRQNWEDYLHMRDYVKDSILLVVKEIKITDNEEKSKLTAHFTMRFEPDESVPQIPRQPSVSQ